jgi:hypothetical protein
MTQATGRYRDPETGRWDYDGDFSRLCKCGHSLGVHSQGGYYCDTDAIGGNEPEARGCECERFVPTGKRRTSTVSATARSAPGDAS